MFLIEIIKAYKKSKYLREEYERERRKFFTKDKKQYSKFLIGEGTYGEPSVYEWGDDTSLVIGKYCSIASGVTILLGGEHSKYSISTYPFYTLEHLEDNKEIATIMPDRKSKGSVTIGNDVWIGYGVTILSGVNVGDGAILGANATVAKDVPSYAIVVGNPSKLIGFRFGPEQIKELLEIKWWEWPSNIIKERKSDLVNLDISSFIQKYKVK